MQFSIKLLSRLLTDSGISQYESGSHARGYAGNSRQTWRVFMGVLRTSLLDRLRHSVSIGRRDAAGGTWALVPARKDGGGPPRMCVRDGAENGEARHDREDAQLVS